MLNTRFFERIDTKYNEASLLEAYKAVYARSTMVLFSRKSGTPLAALTLKADDVGCLSMLTGRPSPGGSSEPHFQGMLNMPDQTFSFVASNLSAAGMINFNILHTPHRVSEVDPGPSYGINEVNELRANESYTIEADQRNNRKMILKGKMKTVVDPVTSAEKEVALTVDESEAKEKPEEGLYFYLSVVPDSACEPLVDKYSEGTIWRCVPGFVRVLPRPTQPMPSPSALPLRRPTSSSNGAAIACPNCGSTNIESDQASGASICTECAVVVEENAIVASVEFVEGAGGSSSLVGQFVRAGSTKAYMGGGGGVGRTKRKNKSEDGLDDPTTEEALLAEVSRRKRSRKINYDAMSAIFDDGGWSGDLEDSDDDDDDDEGDDDEDDAGSDDDGDGGGKRKKKKGCVRRMRDVDQLDDDDLALIEEARGGPSARDATDLLAAAAEASAAAEAHRFAAEVNVGSTQAGELEYGRHVDVHSHVTGHDYAYEHASEPTVLCLSIWEGMNFLPLDEGAVEDELAAEMKEWMENEGKALIEALNAVFKSDTCVVDMESEADTIVCTCGHQCLYHANVGNIHKCPLCRSSITAFVRADGIVLLGQ